MDFEILEELLDSGFVQFDTAPNYGSGYSQNIINSISKKLIVNTKFGQKMNLSFKEIFKRIYRFNNLNGFFKSNLNLINYSFQNKKNFWLVSNIDKNFIEIKKDLSNCAIDTFFLHSPLKETISDQFIMEFIKFCNLNNLVPGISNIQDDIFGAQKVGMSALFVDRWNYEEEVPALRINDLSEILSLF